MVYGEKEEICGYQTLYREHGYYISRLELYEKSLKSFDEAISKTPDDKRALIGRSRARAKACLYEGAIEDVNKALKLHPNDLVVLADKALNTYLICDFEKGLVQNTRLCPIRQKPDNFTMGVMHCSNAIENCLGERAGRPLRDHFKFIRRLAWKRNYEAQKPFEPVPRKTKKKRVASILKQAKTKEPVHPTKIRRSIKPELEDEGAEEILSIKDSLHSEKPEENQIPPFTKPFPFKPLQNYTTNIENYMAEKYLDGMYLEKIFLNQLQTRPGAACPNAKGSEKIKQLAKVGYKTVCYKQELLRTRRPFYFIKYQEATSSGALKSRQEEELKIQQQNTKTDADALLLKIQIAVKERRLKAMIEWVEKLKYYCDSKSKKLLMDKETYLQEIYKNVCEGFYAIYRLNNNQYIWDQEKRIYTIFGLPISRSPSTDSVINEFTDVFVDYKKMVEIYERRLKNAMCSEEMCWCYHELSRFHVELKRWELASVYGRKCMQEGNTNGNLAWVINASMLMTRVDVQQHNKNDAKNQIAAALETAQKLSDSNLVEYLERCLDVIEKIEFDEVQGTKVLEKREKTIVAMMASAKMKDEATHLFRMMAVMPSSRRMLVMPGVRLDEMEKISKSARKMSIMPTAASKTSRQNSITPFTAKRAAKDTTKKQEPRGVGFMELIQYHVP